MKNYIVPIIKTDAYNIKWSRCICGKICRYFLVSQVFMNVTEEEFSTIKSLVGETITKENLRFVDSFVHETLSMFMPVGGNCGYAVSPDHRHPSYMFVLSYDNETTVFVGKNKLEPYPNSIFCLSPEIEHHEVQNYLPPKYCAIFIAKEMFEKNLTAYTQEELCLEGVIVDMKSTKLNMLVKEFMYESQNRHASKEIVLDNLASLVTHEIVRTILAYDAPPTHVSDNQAINEVIRHINTNYEQHITLEELAALSNLSKSHFTKVFSESMKLTPMEYLKTIRLQNAKKMLLSNHLSVTQVSQQCGFNSSSYFTKSFKEAFNETPKEFAQRAK